MIMIPTFTSHVVNDKMECTYITSFLWCNCRSKLVSQLTNGQFNSMCNNDRNLKFSLSSLVIKNNLTFAKTAYFHFRETAIVTYLFSLQ